MQEKAWTALAVLCIACIIIHVSAYEEVPDKIREKLDQVERNLTRTLEHILSDDNKPFTYGRIREALHKLHGLVEIVLWEKKADGTKVPRDEKSVIIEFKLHRHTLQKK